MIPAEALKEISKRQNELFQAMVGQKIAHENRKVTYRTKIIQTDKVDIKGGSALDDFA